MYYLEVAAAQPDLAGYLQLFALQGAQPHFIYRDDAGLELPLCEEGNFTIDFDIGTSDSNVVTIEYPMEPTLFLQTLR